MPRLTSEETTRLFTISPLIRPSRPITIFAGTDLSSRLSATMLPKAEANFTTSIAVRASPGLPPMVPLMPEMLLINATNTNFGGSKNTAFGVECLLMPAVYFCKKAQMSNEWYRAWFDSPYYHKLYFYRDEGEAQDF